MDWEQAKSLSPEELEALMQSNSFEANLDMLLEGSKELGKLAEQFSLALETSFEGMVNKAVLRGEVTKLLKKVVG